MQVLEDAVDSLADRTGFSGVVRVERSGTIELAKAYGLADRAHEIRNTIDTQFAIASGTKDLTALAVVSLIEDGSLDLATTARSVLGGDLPLIDDDVTIEHLLSHRSGIGDYLDEEADHEITDYLMPVPVHELATTEGYLAVLGGHVTAFPPGERFAYCNGGYVVLALIAERTSAFRSTSSCIDGCASRPAWATRSSCGPTSSRGAPRSGISWTTAPGRTSFTCRCAVAGTAESTPPRPTSAPCGARSSPAASCQGTGWLRWCGLAARRRDSRCATASASGSTRRVT
jgi:hypothetical protein